MVDVEGEGERADFTFRGEAKAELPDAPPVETAGTATTAEDGNAATA